MSENILFFQKNETKKNSDQVLALLIEVICEIILVC